MSPTHPSGPIAVFLGTIGPSRSSDGGCAKLATRAAIGAKRMGSARDKFIHARLIGRRIFKLQIVPFPAAACEHCLAVKNAAIWGIS